MTFKLLKKSAGPALVKYHIVNPRGDVIGQANVPPNEVSDFQKHWRGSFVPTASAAAKHQSAVSAISNALRKAPRLSREAGKAAILRGC
jgi:hypothetical protein